MDSHESELIQRWQRGESAAFEEIVRRWQQPIGRFLCRLIGSTDTAADLAQEVFLRVYRARSSYRENGAFDRWIYRVAINVARDASRRKHVATLPLTSQEITARVGRADEICQQKELEQYVVQCVAELPEALRIVLVLRHYEQMNFEQMARLLESPASTLKSRFSVAINRLRQRLEDAGWGPEETNK
jgi:RNA polymerase sigma-70 factor, ECF subfamily